MRAGGARDVRERRSISYTVVDIFQHRGELIVSVQRSLGVQAGSDTCGDEYMRSQGTKGSFMQVLLFFALIRGIGAPLGWNSRSAARRINKLVSTSGQPSTRLQS